MTNHTCPVCKSTRMARHRGKEPLFSCLDCWKTYRFSGFDDTFQETAASKRVATRKPAPIDTVMKHAEERWKEGRE